MTQREDKEKEKTARDMSKLIFTAVVLTNITALFGLTDFSWRSVFLFYVGLIATCATAITGNKILKR